MPRWVLIVAGSAWIAVTVWGVLDPALPLALRIASALAFTLVVGIVPSAAFSGVVAMSAGTASAGAAVGLLVQGSSVGQLLGPPLVVGVGSAVGSWVGGAVTLTCLAACLLVGGLLVPDAGEAARAGTRRPGAGPARLIMLTRLLTILHAGSIASDGSRRGEGRVVGSGRLVAESALRAAIADGDLLPGARLVEADLVAMLGVSRGNIRLAIDALAAEGLVERIPNRGARIRVISTDEAVAITEARMALEALIARKAAERVTAAQADRLARPPRHLARRARGRRPPEVLDAHPAAARAGAETSPLSPVAADLVDRLQAQLVRHQFQLSLRPGRPQVSLGELTALVEAIADRDPDRAEAAAVTHFRSVISALSEPTPDPEALHEKRRRHRSAPRRCRGRRDSSAGSAWPPCTRRWDGSATWARSSARPGPAPGSAAPPSRCSAGPGTT